MDVRRTLVTENTARSARGISDPVERHPFHHHWAEYVNRVRTLYSMFLFSVLIIMTVNLWYAIDLKDFRTPARCMSASPERLKPSSSIRLR